jgi:hypothetical protein
MASLYEMAVRDCITESCAHQRLFNHMDDYALITSAAKAHMLQFSEVCKYSKYGRESLSLPGGRGSFVYLKNFRTICLKENLENFC